MKYLFPFLCFALMFASCVKEKNIVIIDEDYVGTYVITEIEGKAVSGTCTVSVALSDNGQAFVILENFPKPGDELNPKEGVYKAQITPMDQGAPCLDAVAWWMRYYDGFAIVDHRHFIWLSGVKKGKIKYTNDIGEEINMKCKKTPCKWSKDSE